MQSARAALNGRALCFTQLTCQCLPAPDPRISLHQLSVCMHDALTYLPTCLLRRPTQVNLAKLLVYTGLQYLRVRATLDLAPVSAPMARMQKRLVGASSGPGKQPGC